MGQALDIASDFEVFDNTQAVQLRRLVNGDFQTAETVYDALRHQVTEAEAEASEGAVTTQDVSWNLPAVQVVDRPRPGSEILEDNSSGMEGDPIIWTILTVDLATLGSRYRCACRDLALAFGLNEKVNILRPNLQQDAAGAWTPDFFPAYLDVPAKFQEVEGLEVRERGKRTTETRYNVFLGRRLRLSIEYQVVDQDGLVYELLGWTTPDQIDALQTLEVRRVK